MFKFFENYYSSYGYSFGIRVELQEYAILSNLYSDICDSRGREHTLRILMELRNNIYQFKDSGETGFYYWSSDKGYGLHYFKNEVLVYFLFDETHSATYPSPLFDTVLDQAIAFVDAGSDDETALRTAPVVL